MLALVALDRWIDRNTNKKNPEKIFISNLLCYTWNIYYSWNPTNRTPVLFSKLNGNVLFMYSLKMGYVEKLCE